MPLDGEYEPSPQQWVRDQVRDYEASGGAEANTLLDTGMPIIIVTTRGNKSGKLRKTALMRVEHDGEYALVASLGGAPKHPVWYFNLLADPAALEIQDGPEPFDAVAPRGPRRREGRMVGAVRRRLPGLRRLPGRHRARDTGLRRSSRLTRRPHRS